MKASKHYFFLCLLLLNSLAGISATYNVYKEQHLTGNDLYLNAAMYAPALCWHVSHRANNDTIYFDSTKNWHIIDANNVLTDNLFILSAKSRCNFIIDDSYQGSPSAPVFISYGNSNYGAAVGITGIDNRKAVGAIFQCNSYGATGNQTNKGIFFTGCRFTNLNVRDVIRLGNSGGGWHFNDSVVIKNCLFQNIFNPLLPICHSDYDMYQSGLACDAIDNEQTTLRLEEANCTFDHVSGRANAGWGWSLNSTDTIAPIPTYGNWYIHHNTFAHCFKFCEYGSGALLRGLRIEDNNGFDWTSDNGHATSTMGYGVSQQRNKWVGFDRSGEERYGIEGKYDDTIIIRKWTPGCDGTPTVTNFQKKAIEQGGYSHTVSDYVSFEGYSLIDNVRLMPCLLTGKNIISDHQPTSWKGQDNAGMIVFDGFVASGGNAPFIGAEIFPFDSIVIRTNCRESTAIQKEAVIIQLGNKWLTRAFACDLSGSPAPDIISGLYSTSSLQPKVFTYSNVGKIKLWNPAWSVFRNTWAYSYSSPVLKSK